MEAGEGKGMSPSVVGRPGLLPQVFNRAPVLVVRILVWVLCPVRLPQLDISHRKSWRTGHRTQTKILMTKTEAPLKTCGSKPGLPTTLETSH